MVVNAIYHGSQPVHRVYHGGKIIFERSPVAFHVIEDDKLIILGALSVKSYADGLYLDCEPDWIYPEQKGNMLTIEQVYSATQNGNVLEVE